MKLGDLLLAKKAISSQCHKDLNKALLGPTAGRICEIIEGIAGEEVARTCEAIEVERQEFASLPEAKRAFRAVHSGETILFVGAGLSVGGRKSFSGDELRQHLIDELKRTERGLFEDADYGPLSLQDVAQVFIRQKGERELEDCLSAYCEENLPDEALDDHRLLARLDSFRFIFTTNWDRLLEQGFKEQPHHVIRRSEDVTQIRYDAPNIIKLHGDYSFERHGFESRPRVSAEQIANLAKDEPAIHSLMQALFLAHHVVVLGFRPDDYNFAHAISRAATSLGQKAPRVFVVDPDPGLHHLLAWGDVTHVPGKALDFLDGLEGFSKCNGGLNGRWRAGVSDLGAVIRHGPKACDKAEQLGELLGTVERVEVSTAKGPGSPKQRIGRLAASTISDLVRPADDVVFSCGSTLEALAEEADSSWSSFRDVRLYSASVPITDDCSSSAPISLAALFAKRLAPLGVTYRSYQLPLAYLGLVADSRFAPYVPIESPGFSGSAEYREVVDAYLEEAGRSRVFVLGIGATGEAADSGLRRYLASCLHAASDFNPEKGSGRLNRYIEEIESHENLRYIGDLMYWLFKPIPEVVGRDEAIAKYFINSNRLLECLDNKDIAVPFKEFLSRAYCQVRSVKLEALAEAARDPEREVIVAAVGRHKAVALTSACRAQLVNTLVVDEDLCDGMIDLLREGTADHRDLIPAIRNTDG